MNCGAMALSKVMASTSTTNTDLPRQPSSICSPLSNLLSDLQSDPSRTVSSMNMDDLLKNLYPDPSAAAGASQQFHHQNQPPPPSQGLDPPQSFPGTSISREEAAAGKTADEVWKEIVAGSDQRGGDGGGGGAGGGGEEMTLEDFLTKAGAVREDDVRVPVVGYGVDAAAMAGGGGQFQGGVEGAIVPFRNGIDGRVVAAPGPGGRGKRRAVEEPPVDKATQQKQRRMIKNRESAARSRERKQAYTVELESLVTQLEEENARLRREEVEHNKERLKQLMEAVIPVSEKRRPPRALRRVNSMQW